MTQQRKQRLDWFTKEGIHGYSKRKKTKTMEGMSHTKSLPCITDMFINIYVHAIEKQVVPTKVSSTQKTKNTSADNKR